jgi:hypothetical protein
MIIEQISEDDVKETKTGKKFVRVGIKVNGDWHNCTVWESQGDQLREIRTWNKGDNVDVVLFTENGRGDYADKVFNCFKLPTPLDLLIRRVTELESQMAILIPSAPSTVPAHAEVRTPDNDPPKDDEPTDDEPGDDMPF